MLAYDGCTLAMTVFQFYVILWYFLSSTEGFNIDVQDATLITGVGSGGSYFGYSLALANSNSVKTILVGAPRSADPHLPSTKRPGVVYKCNIGNGGTPTCNQLDIDHVLGPQTISFLGKTVPVYNGREDSWLGGSIAVAPGSSPEFVTCAPKWYNIRDPLKVNLTSYHMTGMCYQIPLDFNTNNVQKLPVFIGSHAATVGGHAVWNYPFSGLGMSVHYPKSNSGSHILMGSPGLLDWVGGFADLTGNTLKRMTHDIRTTSFTRPYIGSAMSSGKYFQDGKTYIAAGAPRDNMTGMVSFFLMEDSSFVYPHASLLLRGRDDDNTDLPLNAYFGATLCTMDINRDGADDLLVGAPLYSSHINNIFNEKVDQGLVSVHLGSRQLTRLTFQTPPQILKGLEPYGRFGTAIGNLGDINSDSFPDVAIGAPYENNNKGSVYIYNGYTGGVWPKFSQRIQSSDVNTGLAGFGISISSDIDMNDDNVNDMAIGSYLSDDVVILYGKPIIDLNSAMETLDGIGTATNFVEVDAKANKTFVQVCVSFSDRGCEFIALNVTTTLDLNQTQTRVKFATNNQRIITNSLRVMPFSEVCTDKNRILAVPTFDYTSPIVIRADYTVTAIECSSYDISPTVSRFDGKNPTAQKMSVQRTVQFRVDCTDNICNSNLTLNANAVYKNINGSYLLGTNALRLDIDITKTGDPTYGSMFQMVYPSFLEYTKMEKVFGDSDVTCSLLQDQNETASDIPINEDEASLECMFGNPMYNDTGVSFQIHMRVPSTVTDTSMMLSMSVNTANNEQDSRDNTREISIDMKYNLKALFTGKAKPDTVYMDDLSNWFYIQHLYELDNRGPSAMKEAQINISFPVYMDAARAILFLNSTKTTCDGSCMVTCTVQNPYNTPQVYQQGTGQIVSGSKPSGDVHNVKTLNCTKDKCPMLLCTVHDVPPQKSAIITLEFALRKEIQELLESGKSERIVSLASVQVNITRLISEQTTFNQQLTTTISRSVIEKKKPDWWIFVASGVGGLLLILIIVLILYKVGFFKRKKRDQVREMRKSRAVTLYRSESVDRIVEPEKCVEPLGNVDGKMDERGPD